MRMRALCAFMALIPIWQAAPTAAQKTAAGPAYKEALAIPVQVPASKPGTTHTLVCSARVGPRVPVCAVAFSPDNQVLVTGGYREVAVWDFSTASLSRRLGQGVIAGTVHALAFADHGRLLAVGEGVPGQRGAVRILDMAGKAIVSCDQPADIIYTLAFSPGEKLLAAGGADGAVYVWSVGDRKLVTTLKGHTGAILSVAFSRDGKLLATASEDRTARIWQVADWKQAAMLEQSDNVQAVAFTPDAQYLALAVGGDADRAVRFRHWQNGWQSLAVETGAGKPLGLTWNNAANRLYVPCSDGTIRVMNTNRNAADITLTGHGDWVCCTALSPDGALLASAGADGTVRLWNAADGALLGTLAQIAPNTDRWLIVTAQGYAATSSPEALTWKSGNLKTPAAKLKGILLKPDVVRKALVGQSPPPPALEWSDRVNPR
jgi:WD40 repeat protein